MSFKCNDIKKLVVKVDYLLDNNSEKKEYRQSTGVILRPIYITDYFFVLTTKHSFKEYDEQSFEDVEVDKLNFDDITVLHSSNTTFKPYTIIDTTNDFVVIVIKASFCIDSKIESIKVLESEFKTCGFTGYANVSNGRLKCFDKCTHEIDHDDFIFEINSGKVLQSSNNDEILATKGLSGSGLFTTVNSDYMLTGVISKVITDNNSFDCINVSFLLKDISLEKYGGIEIVTLESTSIEVSSSLQQSSSLQLDEYKIIIQEEVTKEFKKIKDEYLNGTEKEVQTWIDEIKISPKWSILSNQQKAKIVYEEARVSITNESDKTESLVDKVQQLDSSLYVNRLLSWIEFDKGDLAKAILLLDNNEVATLNQKIALYMSTNNFQDVKATLDLIDIKDRNHETYRLKSLYELYRKDDNHEQALKDINKSLDIKDNYLESKRVKAIILFYQSTLYDVLPNLLPPIIQKNALKIDSKSQEKINMAKTILDEVEKENSEYRDKAWIATIKWLINIDEAIEYIQSLYEDKKYRLVAVQFNIIYDLNIDIREDIKNLELDEDINNLYKADTLIRYYFKQEDKKKTFEVLDKYKNIYLEENKIDYWREYYINILINFELYKEALKFVDENDMSRKDDVKAHIYKVTNDYKSASELYEKLFKENKNPIYRLKICEMKSEENNWEYITEYSDYLLKYFQTEKVVELVILGEINSQNFDKANKLIDIWLPKVNSKLIKDSFLKIKATCESSLGFPERSIQIYEKNNFTNKLEDISNLTYFYKKTDSQDKLETLATNVIKNPNIDINSKIQIASVSKNSSVLLQEVINNNGINKSEKELALDLHKNGIINDLVISYLPQLIEDKSIIGQMINLNEIEGYASKINEQKNHETTLYKNSDISIHYLDRDFFNSFCKENQKTLYIRSAKKYTFLELEKFKSAKLYLDITSLLLLFSIHQLQLVIDSFVKVYLPSNIFFILHDINVSHELIELLKINFKLEKLYYAPEVSKEKLKDKEESSNLLLSIYTLLEFQKDNILICIDDRYVNSFQTTKNENEIISVNDILFTFYKSKIITKHEYYSSLLEIRKRKYLFLLISSKEIIYHLKQCKIEGNRVEESEDLKTLKESLQFMVQNFKYIKPFEQTEIENNQYSEPFFVINQVREINHSIIDLWNEDFEYEEDRYIYLNWVLENLFTLNMFSLIKNKLSDNTDITRTMTVIEITSLFIQAITIISDENQKLYFDWIYHNLISKFFKANSELFQNFIDNLSYSLIQSFFIKDLKEEEQIIVIGLISNLPEKIKNNLYENKELIEKLPFEKRIGVNGLLFNNEVFNNQIKKVINGGGKEIIKAIDKNESIILESIIIENQKRIKINNQGFMNDTFMLLSTSRPKRKKLLEANPEWFDMSDTKKKELIHDIINVQNHHERIEKLYQVKEDSKFYSNIQKDLEKQRLNFDSLIPDNIDILLNHFRLDSSLEFNEAFNLSVETFVNEEDILKTIDEIHHFPISFPQQIIDILKDKIDKEQKEILKAFLNTSSTPISHIQLIKVLVSIQNDSYKKFILYLTKKIFTKEFKLRLEAFFAIKKFIKQEFDIKFTTLNDDMKIALIWSHSNKLMKYFTAYSVDYSWILKEFKTHSNRVTLEVFRPDSSYSMDLLNYDLSYEEFVMTSISYITDDNLDYFGSSIIKRKLEELIREDAYPDFTQLTHNRFNAINSFLQLEENSILDTFPRLKEMLEEMEEVSNENNSIFITFFNLKYNVYPLSNDLKNRLVETIEKYTPLSDTEEQVLLSLYDSLFFVKQLKNINDYQISNKVKEDIKNISLKITTKQQRATLFEILIYMPIKQTNNIELRIKLFSKYLGLFSLENDEEIKVIINKLLMELPLEYSKYFLPLKFRTINNKTLAQRKLNEN